MIPRILLCVDMSFQVYRAAAAHKGLSSRRVFTGGLYGFFMTLSKIVRETRATDVAFCRDSKPYKRSEVYPQYKQLRKASADDELLVLYKESMQLVLDALEVGGIRTWAVQGFEADDLAAHCVVKYRGRFDSIYSASNDGDLWQLLWCPNYYVYRKSITDCMTREGLRDLFGHPITPADFMLMTALAGTHNDVEGIPRVGQITALKAIKDPSILRGYREKWGAIIDRNLALIALPHAEFPRAEAIPKHKLTHRSIRNMWSFLGDYDIEITGSMSAAFEQVMEGQGE